MLLGVERHRPRGTRHRRAPGTTPTTASPASRAVGSTQSSIQSWTRPRPTRRPRRHGRAGRPGRERAPPGGRRRSSRPAARGGGGCPGSRSAWQVPASPPGPPRSAARVRSRGPTSPSGAGRSNWGPSGDSTMVRRPVGPMRSRRACLRIRSKASSTETPRERATAPLACSITTRLFRANCSCSVSSSARRISRSWMIAIVATSASAWRTRASSASSRRLHAEDVERADHLVAQPHRERVDRVHARRQRGLANAGHREPAPPGRSRVTGLRCGSSRGRGPHRAGPGRARAAGHSRRRRPRTAVGRRVGQHQSRGGRAGISVACPPPVQELDDVEVRDEGVGHSTNTSATGSIPIMRPPSPSPG